MRGGVFFGGKKVVKVQPFHDKVEEVRHCSLWLCWINNLQGGHLQKGQHLRSLSFFDTPQVIWYRLSEDSENKRAALTKAAKYSVSVSFPPWPRITSVTAANTAQICDTHQVKCHQQLCSATLSYLAFAPDASEKFHYIKKKNLQKSQISYINLFWWVLWMHDLPSV